MAKYVGNTLPITIEQDGITVDESFLAITKSKSFLTKHLNESYLSISSVYPKIIYSTYWIEEKFDGPLTKAGLKIKVTAIYADVIGIEYAKTKTIFSKGHPRMLEVIAGEALIILEQEQPNTRNKVSSYLITVRYGETTVIPPNWKYTIVNTGDEKLVTVEFYKEDQSINNWHTSKKGSGIYIIERNGKPEIVKNSKYKNLLKYATVDVEKYAKQINDKHDRNLIESIDHLVDYIFDIDHQHWCRFLDRTDGEISSF